MKPIYYILFLSSIIISCSSNEQTETTESVNEVLAEENVTIITPDRTIYVDESISSEIELAYDDAQLECAMHNGELCEIKTYEGTLMKASGAAAGFSLKFIPFDSYDYKLERTVKSKYDFDLHVNLSRDQNDVLGYVDYTDDTGNLAWDYFENLFTVYYYEYEGQNYPLKFVDQGKTEWDG